MMSTPALGTEERLPPPAGSAVAAAPAGAAGSPWPKVAAAAEAVAVFAACQLFLWEYSQRYRRFWLVLLAFMIGSVLLRRQSAARLGLRPLHGLASLRWVALGAATGA